MNGAIRGLSELCQELGFESLKNRRWMKKLCYLYKVISSKRPSYLYDLLPRLQKSHRRKSFSQLSAAGLFKYVLPFSGHQTLRG